MKGRESGMPDKGMWEDFFNPAEVLKIMQVDENVKDVAEFGCGYGTFTIPAAKLAQGTVYAIDLEKEMLVLTEKEAARHNLHNIKIMLRDFMTDGTGLRNESVDYVMLFNILHVEHPDILLKESYRILRSQGKLGIFHWNYDPSTPRGPSMDIRPKPEQCIQWAENAGFINSQKYDLKPYHYGIVLTKTGGIK
jgi:ubiquinone/menaquinone biosynthesis C-methylase UbiE